VNLDEQNSAPPKKGRGRPPKFPTPRKAPVKPIGPKGN
jgi:hypothetical protein